MEQWSRMYSAYTQRRFSQASRGGSVDQPDSKRTTGAWKKLSPRTIANRRPGRKKKLKPGETPKPPKPPAILVDTALLRRNLHPNVAKLGPTKQKSGALFVATVSMGSDAQYTRKVTYYEKTGKKNKDGSFQYSKRTLTVPTGVTVRDVMSFHQRGNEKRHLPQRIIFATPGNPEMKRMGNAAKKIIAQELK